MLPVDPANGTAGRPELGKCPLTVTAITVVLARPAARALGGQLFANASVWHSA